MSEFLKVDKKVKDTLKMNDKLKDKFLKIDKNIKSIENEFLKTDDKFEDLQLDGLQIIQKKILSLHK